MYGSAANTLPFLHLAILLPLDVVLFVPLPFLHLAILLPFDVVLFVPLPFLHLAILLLFPSST